MSSKRSLVVAMAFLVALTASLAGAQTKAKKATTAEEKAPRLTIVEPVHEYGEVAKGDKLDYSFVIKNTGNADLQIIAARPGCGCTVADFDAFLAERRYRVLDRVVLAKGQRVSFAPNLTGELAIYRFRKQ